MAAGAIVIACAVRDAAGAQAAGPPLPTLTLDSYPEEARAAIARAATRAEARPQDATAAGTLGMVLHAWEQWDGARAAYRRARHLAPQAYDWSYLEGVVLQRLALPGEAVQAFRRAVQLAPDNLPAKVKLAEALLDSGDRQTSAAAFEAVAGEPAAAPAVAFGRGRLAAAAGRHDEALAHFARAVELFPQFGAAHYAMAQSLRALGRRDEAAVALRKHQQHGAAWPAIDDPALARVAALREDVLSLFRRGLREAAAGDLAAAIASHEAALAREPDLAQVHANLVTLYGRVRRWEKVDDHYKAVVALGFNLDEAHYNYGVALALQGRRREAAHAYRQAVTVNPQHADAWNNLGQLLEDEGSVAEALEAYRQSVKARPTFRLARFNLGRMLLGQRRPAEAAAELEQLREPRDAEAPRYLFGLSVAYVQLGRRQEGIAVAREARALALEHRQAELAAAIERDLAALQ